MADDPVPHYDGGVTGEVGVVRMDGIDMGVELVLSALVVEKGGDDFSLIEDDTGIILLEMLSIGAIPVFLELLGRHQIVRGDEVEYFSRVLASD